MSDLDRIELILGDTPYMTRAKANRLVELFERLKPQRIVEIGTYHGAGACYLAELSKPYGGLVTTIDRPYSVSTPKPEELLAKCGLTERVKVIRREDGAEGWFHDFLRSDDGYTLDPLDFVYIDGGHTWLHVCAQFAMAYAAVKHGGWIVFDDYNPESWPDVYDAVEFVVSRYPVHWRQDGDWAMVMKR